MLNKWKEKRHAKKLKQMEKYKRPTLQDKLAELELKYGDSKMKFIDGNVHYFFEDGTEVYFHHGFAGIEIVYVKKGYLYDAYNY